MTKTPDTVAGRLRYAREHRGYSAADLRHEMAEQGVKVSRSRLWNYENRPESMPKPEILAVISEVTGFSAGWLMTGREPMFQADDAIAEERPEELRRLIETWHRLAPKKRRLLAQIVDLLADDSATGKDR